MAQRTIKAVIRPVEESGYVAEYLEIPVVTQGKTQNAVHSQRGSRVKLRRVLAGDVIQTLTVPTHPDLDTGTCRAVLRQATRFVSEEELNPYFYSD